jgi:hypothetical protein
VVASQARNGAITDVVHLHLNITINVYNFFSSHMRLHTATCHTGMEKIIIYLRVPGKWWVDTK